MGNSDGTTKEGKGDAWKKNLNFCKDANISINDFATRILIKYEHKTWQMGKLSTNQG